MTQRFFLPSPFELESGGSLYKAELAFETQGVLNTERDNAVLYLHALSGSASLEVTTIDTSKYFVISPNVLGSCYGSTGPESIDPRTGHCYRSDFPEITIRDIAKAVLALLEELRIDRLSFAIGGSFGAMVVLELAFLAPDKFGRLIILSCGAEHSAWRIAFSSVIRKTIERAIANAEDVDGAFALARQLAMITYRSPEEFNKRFGRTKCDERFDVESYLEHQGDKITARFSPYSYVTLTRAMESYSLFEGRFGTRREILSRLTMPILIIGASSDILYPESELRIFTKDLPNARYVTLHAPYGHDSFLVAEEKVSAIVYQFLTKTEHEYHCSLA